MKEQTSNHTYSPYPFLFHSLKNKSNRKEISPLSGKYGPEAKEAGVPNILYFLDFVSYSFLLFFFFFFKNKTGRIESEGQNWEWITILKLFFSIWKYLINIKHWGIHDRKGKRSFLSFSLLFPV